MGRRKIEIQPITHERNRSVTFLKRKNGLFKKAYELGVLCSVDVAVIIFEDRPGSQKLFEYSSKDIRDIVARHAEFDGERDSRGSGDFSGAGGKADDAIGEDDEDGDDEPLPPPPPPPAAKRIKGKTPARGDVADSRTAPPPPPAAAPNASRAKPAPERHPPRGGSPPHKKQKVPQGSRSMKTLSSDEEEYEDSPTSFHPPPTSAMSAAIPNLPFDFPPPPPPHYRGSYAPPPAQSGGYYPPIFDAPPYRAPYDMYQQPRLDSQPFGMDWPVHGNGHSHGHGHGHNTSANNSGQHHQQGMTGDSWIDYISPLPPPSMGSGPYGRESSTSWERNGPAISKGRGDAHRVPSSAGSRSDSDARD
ncbi:unnamed protein product [Mycena citricolor]|uniref:MADS-box domain-containing protein n=1 Tax=Mycena citricolor TaxID=2018698 RepID=A0AAD2HC70_9AGAR|nr:unnamed protein product [Mycena citricolor]